MVCFYAYHITAKIKVNPRAVDFSDFSGYFMSTNGNCAPTKLNTPVSIEASAKSSPKGKFEFGKWTVPPTVPTTVYNIDDPKSASTNITVKSAINFALSANFNNRYNIALDNQTGLDISNFKIFVLGYSSDVRSQVYLAPGNGTTAVFKPIPYVAPGSVDNPNVDYIPSYELGKEITNISISGNEDINGARLYFFIQANNVFEAGKYNDFANKSSFGPKNDGPQFKYWCVGNASKYEIKVVQPKNPPQTDYPIYNYAEFSFPQYSDIYIDASSVDGFFYPVTLTQLDSDNNPINVGGKFAQVGQPYPGPITSKTVIDSFKTFINGLPQYDQDNNYAQEYLKLILDPNPTNPPSPEPVTAIVNPGNYLQLNTDDSLSSKLHFVFDDALNTIFTNNDFVKNISIWQNSNSPGSGKIFTATISSNETFPGTANTHPALKFTSGSLNYLIFNPVGFSVVNYKGADQNYHAIKGKIKSKVLTFDTPFKNDNLIVGMYVSGPGTNDLGNIHTVPPTPPTQITQINTDNEGNVVSVNLAAAGDTPEGESYIYLFAKAPTHYYFSPGCTVFGCLGLLGNGETIYGKTEAAVYVSGIENQIATALNRGVAVYDYKNAADPNFKKFYTGDGNTTDNWATEAKWNNWYPANQPQNLFSLFMHTGTVNGTPIFTQPFATGVATSARNTSMSMAYGFAYDENPVHDIDNPNAPQVPSEFTPTIMNANATTIKITLGHWNNTQDKCQLTMTASTGGSVTAPAGPYPVEVNTGTPVNITALASNGYSFDHWAFTTGSGTITDLKSAATTATISSSTATIQANFSQIPPTTAKLTMAVSPDSGTSSTVPAVGTYDEPINTPINITADADPSYSFTSWSIDKNGTIKDAKSANTSATITGDAKITANFAKNIQYGPLTMAVSADSGNSTTDPVPGTYNEPLNQPVAIEAKADANYEFTGWTPSGSVKVDDSSLAKTNATVTATVGGTVTANFKKNQPLGKLTMQVSPEGSGSTNPSGSQSYSQGVPVPIVATPAQGSNYHFVNWTTSGTVTVANPLDSSTTAVLTGPAGTITANFAQNPTGQLTLAVSPGDAGTLNPGAGTYTRNIGDPLQVTATANSGYIFVSWTANKNTRVSDMLNPATTVILLADPGTVTANFATDKGDGKITMAVFPDASYGSTNPGTGVHNQKIGEPFSIEALPANGGDGYIFKSWTHSAGASVTDPLDATTTAILTSDTGTITANFAKSTAKATLVISVNPADPAGGTTNPGAGSYTEDVGEPIQITATANAGYHFVSWSATGKVSIINPTQNTAYAVLETTDGGTVTANFAENGPKGTLTIAVHPTNPQGGTTNPAAGTYTDYTEGEPVPVSAIPSNGYRFVSWSVEGKVNVVDPFNKDTDAFLIGDTGTLTANFALVEGQAMLTLNVSPNGSGTTTPATGQQNIGERVAITASPAVGTNYHFISWTPSGNVSIVDPLDSSTFAILKGTDGGTVTANFAIVEDYGDLAMAVSPDGGGTTIPPAKEQHSEPVGVPIPIFANPSAGYHFVSWTADKNVAITDPLDSSTYATLTDKAGGTVTANFAENSKTGTLTMAALPTDAGSTIPGVGPSEQNQGEMIPITANPAPGYHFTVWTSSGNVSIIGDVNSNPSTAVLTGNTGTITAIFAEDQGEGQVTMAVYPNASYGSTSPGAGTPFPEKVGNPFGIRAISSKDCYFTGWAPSGNIIVTNPGDSLTSAVVTSTKGGTITANFAKSAGTADLTLAVSPENAGTSNPGAGTHPDQPVGVPIPITATANADYHFTSWTADGAVAVTDPFDSSTTATITSTKGGTITANFAKTEGTGTLTLAVYPENGGTTNPGAGAHPDQPVGAPIEIIATASQGFHFTSWKVEGNVSVVDSLDSSTFATLLKSDGGKVTANFAVTEGTGDLILAVLPEGGGNTNPGTGTHTVNIGEPTEITALPADDYHFESWKAEGNVSVADPLDKSTFATLLKSDGGKVTAIFAKTEGTGTLTIAISPAGGGTTNPGTGPQTINIGEPVQIAASANDGYHFTSWSMAGNVDIMDPFDRTTYATLKGASGTVTANFTKTEGTGELTLAVAPENGGTTNPGAGKYTQDIGAPVQISANEADGYHFTSWSMAGNVDIMDPFDRTTYATLKGASGTVIANFAKTEGTGNLTISVYPEDFGHTIPGTGTYAQNIGTPLGVQAFPSDPKQYYFTCWTAVGNVVITDPLDDSTTVILKGAEGTVTANFAEIEETGQLTMAVSPDDGGTTTPVPGASMQNVGQPVKILATPNADHHFISWVAEGNVYITDPLDSSTYATLSSVKGGKVTANFTKSEGSAELTIAVSPQDSGTTAPGTGTYMEPIGKPVEISAYPADGYHFAIWIADGANVAIEDPLSSSTYATLLSGDGGTVTANFAKSEGTAELTIAVFPEDGGTTNPGAGTYAEDIGKPVKIEANDADGYHFINWTVEGNASITDPFDNSTYATLTSKDGGKVTANFAKTEGTAELTIAVSPDDSGTTNPGEGTHTVDIGEPVQIAALAADGYHFTNWTTLGNVSVFDPLDFSTYATVTAKNGGKVTARFDKSEGTAKLTIAVSHPQGGKTSPAEGTYTEDIGKPVQICAYAADGYHFTSWTAEGNVSVFDPLDSSTYATLTSSDGGTVTANFAKTEGTAELTIAVSPDDGGTTNPGEGTYTEPIGKPVEILAFAADGYHFTSWTAEGNVSLFDPLDSSTYATLTSADGGKVTANFDKSEGTAELTIAVSPPQGGTTNPGEGTYTEPIGKPVEIVAFAADGYHFTSWTATGNVYVTDPLDRSTYATLTTEDGGTVTANFAKTEGKANLTMAVSPEKGGTTNPGAGIHAQNIGEPVEITAVAAKNYHFVSWTATGNVSVTNPIDSSTYAILTSADGGKVTANFAETEDVGNLTLAVLPENGGTTNPGTGTHPQNIGEAVQIAAIAADGYHFASWSRSGDIQITNVLDNPTFATITSTAGGTATAVFAQDGDQGILTMLVSPDDGGTTNPGKGTHTVDIGEQIQVSANPADGYIFTGWSKSGSVAVANPFKNPTTAILTGEAGSVTANFTQSAGSGKLTMEVSPDGGGTTNPGEGTHDIAIGQPVEIIATAAAGFHFTNWTAEGNVSIANILLYSTTAMLTGDAGTATANFAEDISTGTLTMAVSPDNSGGTEPVIGQHAVFVGEAVEIGAAAAAGYHFTGWSETGEIWIFDTGSPVTIAFLTGEKGGTATANFAADVTTVTITMAVSPESSGETIPSVGTHTYQDGESISIMAFAANTYHFVSWTNTGNSRIADRRESSTTVLLSGDDTITANFEEDADLVELVMAANPPEGGTVNPGAAKHLVHAGEVFSIDAVPSEGFYFGGWSVAAGSCGEIFNTSSASTSAVIYADSTFTAYFSSFPITFVAKGSILEVTNTDVGIEGNFNSKPSVAAMYRNPITGSSTSAQLPVVTPASKKFPVPRVGSSWAKSQLLYAKKAFAGKDVPVSELFLGNPVNSVLSYLISVKSKDVPISPVVIQKNICIVPPVIRNVYGNHSKAGDVFEVCGMYFGEKLPSLEIEYYTEKDGVKSYSRKKCKVLKKDASGKSLLPFMDAKGKPNSSCMKILDDGTAEDIGYSVVFAEYPSLKEWVQIPTGYVVLTNGQGIYVFNMGP